MANVTSLTVTKVHHSCLLVGDGQTTVLIDPGLLGAAPELDDIDALLVTHNHPDHLDPEVLAEAVRRGIPAWAPADLLAGLPEAVAAGTREATPGESFPVGTLTVRVAGCHHAELHPTNPGPQNRAYLINEAVFVTGDEHAEPPGPVVTLVTPINAPWLRGTDLIRYVQALRPRQVVGVHDGLLNDAGLSVARMIAASLTAEGAGEAFVADDGQVVTVSTSA